MWTSGSTSRGFVQRARTDVARGRAHSGCTQRPGTTGTARFLAWGRRPAGRRPVRLARDQFDVGGLDQQVDHERAARSGAGSSGSGSSGRTAARPSAGSDRAARATALRRTVHPRTVPPYAHPMADALEFIAGMPKAELHLHIEGTLEPELKFELAARNGLAAAVRERSRRCARRTTSTTSPSFLAVYYEGMSVLLDRAGLLRPRDGLFPQGARAERRLRRDLLRPAGAHLARRGVRRPSSTGIRRAQQRREASVGVRSQLIMCFLRDLSAESAMETLEQALPYGDSIVGVGLDSDERGNPPVKFREVFARARARGLPADDALRRRPGRLGRAHLAVPRRDRGRAGRPRRERARGSRARRARSTGAASG